MAINKAGFLLLLLAVSISASSAALVGGYRPITDPSAPEVQEIARYAIAEHNKQKPPKLSYVSVVSGESQVVAGTNYRLRIRATDSSGVHRLCVAVVWDKPWEKFRQLTSFQILR